MPGDAELGKGPMDRTEDETGRILFIRISYLIDRTKQFRGRNFTLEQKQSHLLDDTVFLPLLFLSS